MTDHVFEKKTRNGKHSNWETGAIFHLLLGEQCVHLFSTIDSEEDCSKIISKFQSYSKNIKIKRIFKMTRLKPQWIEIRCKVANDIKKLSESCDDDTLILNEDFVRNLFFDNINSGLYGHCNKAIFAKEKPHEYGNYLTSYQIYLKSIYSTIGGGKMVTVVDSNKSVFKWIPVLSKPLNFSDEGLEIFKYLNYNVNSNECTVSEISSLLKLRGVDLRNSFRNIQNQFRGAFFSVCDVDLQKLPKFWVKDIDIDKMFIAEQPVSLSTITDRQECDSSLCTQFYSQLNIRGD
jgi:hypothetical protein